MSPLIRRILFLLWVIFGIIPMGHVYLLLVKLTSFLDNSTHDVQFACAMASLCGFGVILFIISGVERGN